MSESSDRSGWTAGKISNIPVGACKEKITGIADHWLAPNIFTIFLIAVLLVPVASAAIRINPVTPADIDICESTKFAVYLNNTGAAADDISVKVTVPDGFVYDTGTSVVTYPHGSSTADPSIDGPSLNWQGDDWMLLSGEHLKIEFNLTALCGTQSGNRLLIEVNYSGGLASWESKSIVANQGLISITKEPTVIEAHQWDVVSWDLVIQNSGSGPAFNVQVDDTPTHNLQLVNIDSPNGQLSWSYDRLDPGEVRVVNATFVVAGCSDLYNEINISWGCSGFSCQETYAKGSIKFVPREPNLEYEFSPDPIIVPYCGSTRVTVNMTNFGDDVANATDLHMEFRDMPVNYIINESTVTGATYIPSLNTFIVGTIPPNQYKSFSFDFEMPYGACDAKGESGVINVYPLYGDNCGNPWYPPVYQIGYSMDGSTIPSISVSKTGKQEQYVGEIADYYLNVTYASGNCGMIECTENVIVDTYPSNFEILNPAGGEVDTANHTITWINESLVSGTVWSKTITMKASKNPLICNCGHVFVNECSVDAAIDCCGCVLRDNSSLDIIVECFNESVLTSSSKKAGPSRQENCRTITYNNLYVFNHTEGLTWGDISFVEWGANGQVFPGGSPTGKARFEVNGLLCNETDITLGSSINLAFLESGCGLLADGDELNVTYSLYQLNSGSFVDWSSLCVSGFDSGCGGVSCFQEDAAVTVDVADYSVAISGIPDRVSQCMGFNLTIDIIKNSPDEETRWTVHDMSLTYDDANYQYIGPCTISGIINQSGPVESFEPVRSGSNLTWSLGENVTMGGKVTFRVEKRCPLEKDAKATLQYLDNCGGPQTKTASSQPSLLTGADLILDKTPEVIFARDRQVSWKIYVTNKGSGTAYNVSVVDSLGDDLNYTGSRIRRSPSLPFESEPENTSVVGPEDCGPDQVRWMLGVLKPKQQVTIELNATLCGCYNRNNDVSAMIRCAKDSCQIISDSSRVELVKPELVVVRHEVESVDDCGREAMFLIEIRNAGSVIYNITVNDTIPSGLTFSGTPEITGEIPNSTTISGNKISWRFDNQTGWKAGSKVAIKFWATVTEDPCEFEGGLSRVEIDYKEPCGRAGPRVSSQTYVQKYQPDLIISKTPSSQSANSGDRVSWTITLENAGDYISRNVTLFDVLPVNVASPDSQPHFDSGTGTFADPLVWNLEDIPVGGKLTITMNATVESCTTTTYDDARVTWGCCPEAAVARAELKTVPDIGASIGQGELSQLGACGGDFSIIISNAGSTAFITNITDELPVGFVYDDNTAVINSTNLTHQAGFVDEPVDYTVVNRTVVWSTNNIDRVYPGEVITIRFKAVSCPDCCRTTTASWNNVSMNFTDSCGNALSREDDQPVTPKKGVLSVRKEPEVQLSGSVFWTIQIDNNGTEPSRNVTVTDILGDGFTSVSASGGSIVEDMPYPNWTTIIWAGQEVPMGPNTWSAEVSASTIDMCGLTHTNEVQVQGICPTGCVYSLDGDKAYAWTVAVFELDSLEELLRGQTTIISSFEGFLRNSSLDEQSSIDFLRSFDDLAKRQLFGVYSFEDIVRCNWNDIPPQDRIKFTASFEDLVRREAISLSSNQDLLIRAWCKLDPATQSQLLSNFEDRLKEEQGLLHRFEGWLGRQQYLNDPGNPEYVAWLEFMASYEDLTRREAALIQSFIQLMNSGCQGQYFTLVKAVDATSVVAGSPVTYSFNVTNTGTYPLENITVSDSSLGLIEESLTLAPGEYRSTELTTSHQCAGCSNCRCQLCNIATACGNVIFDAGNNSSACVISNEVCISLDQPLPGSVYPG